MERQLHIYRSSKSRLTKKQLEYNGTNQLIFEFINTLTEPRDAEYLWLEFSKKGHKMSMSSFYGHLKRLVETELIIKVHFSHNKFLYKPII